LSTESRTTVDVFSVNYSRKKRAPFDNADVFLKLPPSDYILGRFVVSVSLEDFLKVVMLATLNVVSI